MKTQSLLIWLSADFRADDVDALRELVATMVATARWTLTPPSFVDETDDSSCTQPEDEPIRTVGSLLTVTLRDASPATPVEEVQRFLEAMAAFAAQRGLDIEIELDATHAGRIQNGVIDDVAREGLIATW